MIIKVGGVLKSIFKMGAKIFGKLFLANFLCIITVISLSFLTNMLFTKEIGYEVINIPENREESVSLYTHYYSDGEDKELEKYEKKEGYNLKKVTIRSEISGVGQSVFTTLSLLFTLSLAGTLIYSSVWKEGNKDLNLMRFNRISEDKYKGLKIGFVASAPYLLMLLVLLIGKNSFAKTMPIILYKWLNSSFYSIIDIICGKTIAFGNLEIWRFILLFLVQLILPAFCAFAYYIGYKDILISEKLIYKNEKK